MLVLTNREPSKCRAFARGAIERPGADCPNVRVCDRTARLPRSVITLT